MYLHERPACYLKYRKYKPDFVTDKFKNGLRCDKPICEAYAI